MQQTVEHRLLDATIRATDLMSGYFRIGESTLLRKEAFERSPCRRSGPGDISSALIANGVTPAIGLFSMTFTPFSFTAP